jgi:hypothetical protein
MHGATKNLNAASEVFAVQCFVGSAAAVCVADKDDLSGVAVDDPDVAFFENYGCGSLRNDNNDCDAEMTKLFQAQSRELDPKKRQQMV